MVAPVKESKSAFEDWEFFIDPSRCIGCQACVQACGECDTHRGTPMIHLDYVEVSVQHVCAGGSSGKSTFSNLHRHY